MRNKKKQKVLKEKGTKKKNWTDSYSVNIICGDKTTYGKILRFGPNYKTHKKCRGLHKLCGPMAAPFL